jgi:predicted nucleotidyltransferase
MREKIQNKLAEVASEKQIEILYACESGSRVWGFASPDSDFDIRFIYKNETSFYLNLWERKDTIEFMTSDDLDGAGWDLDKALKLLAKSNVPLMEWLHSPVTYYINEPFLGKMREFSKECFSPISGAWHYLSTAQNHLEACKGEDVKLKSYFYALRNTLAAKWIVMYHTLPPVAFSGLMPIADEPIRQSILHLMEIKSRQDEKYRHPNEVVLLAYMTDELKGIESAASSLPQGKKIPNELNEFFIQEIRGNTSYI